MPIPPPQLHPSWVEPLAPVADQITQLGEFLIAEHHRGHTTFPQGKDIFRAFTYPFDEVKVLIVGQDPYPTPGHAIGLSFACNRQVSPLPRSLANIYAEFASDLGVPAPTHGDLTGWAEAGVMLLNRVLTVQSGAAGSHRGKGWEAVTDQAITALVERDQPLVAVLWGRDAQNLSRLLGDTPIIASPHPSPLSAHRGFFGSRPFSRANELLASRGAEPIDWVAASN